MATLPSPVISFSIMFYYLTFFETKGEDKRKIVLLEGTKAGEVWKNADVCIEK